jgi:homoserine dehydrogenase
LNGTILESRVGPALVPINSPFAKTVDNQNAIVFTGEKSGDTLLAGRGAGGDPTAVAVVSDLLAIAHASQFPRLPSVLCKFASCDLKRKHYLRAETKRRKNVVDSVTRALADCGVEISKALEPSDEKRLEWAFALKPCGRLVLEEAIDHITKLDGIAQNTLALPILTK